MTFAVERHVLGPGDLPVGPTKGTAAGSIGGFRDPFFPPHRRIIERFNCFWDFSNEIDEKFSFRIRIHEESIILLHVPRGDLLPF